MSPTQWAILVPVLVVVSALSLTPLLLPLVVLLAMAVVILLYRIGNSLQMGFNEHTKAMQAIYDEIVRHNHSAKPLGDSTEPPTQSG